MQALVYRKSIPRYVAGLALARLWPRRFLPGLAPLRLEEIPRPDRAALFGSRAGEWALLRPLLCGICGSDLNLLRGKESFLLEPYASFPAVLGHEVLAEVVEPPAGSTLRPGQRVVVEPVLHCAVRGLPLCDPCRRGETNYCERFTEGPVAPGVVLGYNATVGGGMAEFCLAHETMLHAVPEHLPDETAVLTDSLASALQPVVEHFPGDHETVLVLGAGIIGQHVVRALRALGSRASIVVAARRPFQKELALRGGADEVLLSPDRHALGAAVGARPLATSLDSLLGGGNLEGGCHRVFDCVASARSIQDSLLALRARGTCVMIGTAGAVSGVDVSSLWFRGLTVAGSNCYGQVSHQGKTMRTYSLALEILARESFPAAGLLRHLFPLASWREAFACVFEKKTHASMKAAFDLRPAATTGTAAITGSAAT